MERRRSAADRLEETTMRYRTVGCLVILTLSLLMAPLATQAQPREKIQGFAVLDPTPPERPSPCLLASQQGLRALGYVEGQSILLDYRYAEGHVDRHSDSRGGCSGPPH